MSRELSQHFVQLRRRHPAWLLLASRNGPLTLACLKSLFEANPGGVSQEDAVEQLADTFATYANDSEFDVGGSNDDDDAHAAARRELRLWLKKGLIVERDGRHLATNALQRAFGFLAALEDRAMTSTASRLATVQREIEELEARLNGNPESRAHSLREKIAALEQELAAVERGEFEVLDGPRAEEGIREVHQLAVSLRADFRRVEDSYREADRALRHRILGEKHHRGEIVDELLAGHEAMVQTPEGQTFEGFHEQLVQTAELDRMKARLRSILDNPHSAKALERRQKAELRQLVPRLVEESERVIQARARSERDVRGFLKSGLADEQLRVGAVLQDLFETALHIDWSSQRVRRSPSPLPPVAVTLSNLPLAERYLVKEAGAEHEADLDFSVNEADPSRMDAEFWHAYLALDRARLFESTLAHLRQTGQPLTLLQLAEALPPTHDLETLAYWLALAREAEIEIEDAHEVIDLFDETDGWTRFHAPKVSLTSDALTGLNPEELE